jgi:hypothetical protein
VWLRVKLLTQLDHLFSPRSANSVTFALKAGV